MNISVKVLTTADEFRLYKNEWAQLHKEAKGGPFSSFEWIDCWNTTMLDQSTLPQIAVAFDGGKMAAAVPLGRRMASVSSRLKKLRRPQLTMLAQDRAGFHEIMMGQGQDAAVTAILDHLKTDAPAPYLDFSPLAASAGQDAWLSAARDSGLWTRQRVEIKASFADLSDGWDAYLARRSARFRKTLRQRIKKIDAANSEFCIAQDASAASASIMEQALDLSAVSWKSDIGTDIGSKASDRAFMSSLFAELAPQGRMRVHLLMIENKPAASSICLIENNIVYELVSDFDDQFAAFAPGRYASSQAMKKAALEGRTGFDMLRSTHFTDSFADRFIDHSRLTTALRPNISQMVHMTEAGARSLYRRFAGQRVRVQGRKKFFPKNQGE